MKSIIKKELYIYFRTPLAVMFATVYLLVCGISVFYNGRLLEKNTADLSIFFKINVWMYVFLVPALSMRLFSEEEKNGTGELLYTLPVSSFSIVIGKYIASLFFLSLTLFLTFPYVLTVNYFGNPDNGIIVAGYFSTLFLGAAFLATGVFFSSLTKNQIIAFILTALFCLFFVVIGTERCMTFLIGYFPLTVVKLVASLGFVTHFSSVTKGIIFVKDIVFFITFCGLWLYLTIIKIDLYNRNWWGLRGFLALVIFISLNIFSYYSLSFLRFDMTEDRLYTLSEGTEKIINEIKEPIVLKVYISSNITDKSPKFADYAAEILDTLDCYRDLGRGKIAIELYDPKPFSSYEEDAIAYGLYSVEVDKLGNRGYLGLVAVNSLGETAKIPFFDVYDENSSEYKISKVLFDLSGHKRLSVGVLSGIEEIDGVGVSPLTAISTFRPRWAFMEELRKNYDVRILSPYRYDLPDNIDILILINPKAILDKTLYSIDQFLMRGGKLLVFTDPYVESEDLYDRTPVMNTNIDTVLAKWGINVSHDFVVLDPMYSRTVNVPKEGKRNYPGWLSLNDNSVINLQSKITRGLKILNFASAGYLDIIQADGISADILLKTSSHAGVTNVANIMKTGDNAAMASYYTDGKKELPLAVHLHGVFPSAFAEPPARIVGKNWTYDHLLQSDPSAEIIVVADIDFLYEGMWGKRIYERSMTPVINAFASNCDFVVNAIDYLGGQFFLNRVRDKKMKSERKLKKISDKIAKLNAEYRKKETILRIALLKGREQMNTILNNHDSEDCLSDELKKVVSLENGIHNIREEIAESRNYAMNTADTLINRIKWVNILIMPVFIMMFYFISVLIRNRKNI